MPTSKFVHGDEKLKILIFFSNVLSNVFALFLFRLLRLLPIWLVDTAYFNKAVLSNIVLTPVGNFNQIWLVTIRTFWSVFCFVLKI